MRTWWRGQHVKSTLKSGLQCYATGQNFLYSRFDQLRISATTNKKKLTPFNFKVGRTSTRKTRKCLCAASKSVPDRQMTCQNKRERIPFRGKLTSKMSFQEMCHIHIPKKTRWPVSMTITPLHTVKMRSVAFAAKFSIKNQNLPPSDRRWTSMDSFWASSLLLPTPPCSCLLHSAPRSEEDQRGAWVIRKEQSGAERIREEQGTSERSREGHKETAPPCSSPWSCSHVYSIIQPLKSAWIWPGQMFEPCM